MSKRGYSPEQLHLSPARPAPRALGPGAGEARVAADVGERVAHDVGGGGIAASGQPQAALGGEHGAGAVGEQAVEPGHGGRARGQLPGGARACACGPGVQAVGHQHQPRGPRVSAEHGAQEDLGPGAVTSEQRARSEHLGGEPAEHLCEPVERVRVARAILGVTVEWQVGEHHAEAIGERLDGRLPLLVREQRRMHQRERRPGAQLTVGDAGAVRMVVEAQPHALMTTETTTHAS